MLEEYDLYVCPGARCVFGSIGAINNKYLRFFGVTVFGCLLFSIGFLNFVDFLLCVFWLFQDFGLETFHLEFCTEKLLYYIL